MAVSKIDCEKVDAVNSEANTDGLEVLRWSLEYFKYGLIQFRVCHDFCLPSGLLDSEATINLDQCAIDFRQLSICVASLAEKIASLWCTTCVMFYKNFDKISGNPSKILDNMANQAKDLNLGFEHIKTQSGSLVNKFSTIECHKLPVHQQFVKMFEDKSDTAVKEEQLIEKDYTKLAAKKEKTKEELERLQKVVNNTEDKLIKFHHIPLLSRFFKDSKEEEMLAALKQHKTMLEQEITNTEELEKISAENLKKTKALVAECKSQESKAEVSFIYMGCEYFSNRTKRTGLD